MVYRSVPGNLRQNEVEWLENFEIVDQHYATKRPAFLPMNDVALDGPIQGIFDHRPSDGEQHLIVVAGGTIYKYDTVLELFEEIDDGYDDAETTRVFFVPFDDLLILLNGVDAPLVYDPGTETVAALGGSPPIASCGAQYYHHLVLNAVAEPARVYYSETDDPEQGYSATNYFFDVTAGGDSSAVTGFLVRDQELLIGKARSISVLRGSSPREFSQPQNRSAYSTEQGLSGPQLFIEVAGAPWFGNESGIWSLRAPFDTPEQSWSVDGFFNQLDPERLRRGFAVRLPNRDQVIFWVPRSDVESAGCDLGLVARPGFGRGGLAAWSMYLGIQPTCAAVGRGSVTSDVLYVGNEAGIVSVQTSGQFSDGGDDPIYAQLRTGHNALRTPDVRKLFRSTVVELEIGAETTILVRYVTDRGRKTGSKEIIVAGGGLFYTGIGMTGDELGDRDFVRARYQHDTWGHRIQHTLVSSESEECRVGAIEEVGFTYERREKL